MKRWIALIPRAMALLGIVGSAFANHHLDGVWESEKGQIVLIVESTQEGIRVKRSDQDRWYDYQELRENQFRDKEGNMYFLLQEKTLEWEDRTGKKHLKFFRKDDHRPGVSSGHRDRDVPHRSNSDFNKKEGDIYIQRNHYYGRPDGDIQIYAHHLAGQWINRTTGQLIHIKARNSTLRVKAHRGGWSTFYRKDKNTFMDDSGNRYDFTGNSLVYRSRIGDFRMEFKRY